MSNILQWFLFGCGLAFSLTVIYLIIKHRLNERISVIWLCGSFLILFIAGQVALIDHVAAWLHISYPPSLLFLLSSLILLLFNLYQTIQISKLNTKIKDVTQYLALKEEPEIPHMTSVIYKEKSEVNES